MVEISSVGREILDFLIVPEASLTWPSRTGIGAETSGRLWRLVRARVKVVEPDIVNDWRLSMKDQESRKTGRSLRAIGCLEASSKIKKQWLD